MPKILVVDDEENIVELLKFNLEREGFKVISAFDGNTALEIARKESPDLIILDVMLPGRDGLAVCNALRQDLKLDGIPIIMLSARVEEIDRVVGLEIGADDYVTKPFSPRELTARVKAQLRRLAKEKERVSPLAKKQLLNNDLVIDPACLAVTFKGIKQDFTPKEFELFYFLVSNPGKVFTREYLVDKIWGYDFTGDMRMIDVHIRHIRHKLEKFPEISQLIETIRGVGYRFREVP